MTARQVISRVKKIEMLESKKKALEEQISFLKAEIQEEMQEQEVLEVGDYIVRWTNVCKNNFDSKTFKAQHPRLYKKYIKSVESRRFSIA